MAHFTNSIQVLIIHVRGQKDRERFISKQMESLGLPFRFITEGNKEDLTPDILDRYFVEESALHNVVPRTSCAYKHLLATEYIIEHNLPGALIIEDDLKLYDNFKEIFFRSLKEYEEQHIDEPFIANYEESSLMLVKRSQRRKGKYLYPAQRDRFAGCYYLSRQAAENIMEFVNINKSSYNSDELHSFLISQGLIKYYWSYPCIACQCSCDGSMPTMIPTRPRPFKRMKWFYKRFYKHLLFLFR